MDLTKEGQMAKGWDRVEQMEAAREERQAEFEANNKPQLWLRKGEGCTGRFLEQGQDINNFQQHEYHVPDPNAYGGSRRKYFTCLQEIQPGTECPGCKAGLKLKLKGAFNVIQRDRPVIRRGADGKAMKGSDGKWIVDGHRDEVVILIVPSTTLNMLRKKDAAINGLMSRDVTISKTGEQFQPFVVDPADIDSGPQPLSEADQALLAKKHDLDDFMKPPTFQEAADIVAKYGNVQAPPSDGGGQQASAQPAPVQADNPFLATR